MKQLDVVDPQYTKPTFNQIRAKFSEKNVAVLEETNKPDDSFKKTQKFFEQQKMQADIKCKSLTSGISTKRPALLPKPILKEKPAESAVCSPPPESAPLNGCSSSKSQSLTCQYKALLFDSNSSVQPNELVNLQSKETFALHSQSSSTSSLPVRSAIQHFNKFGPRLFEMPAQSPSSPSLPTPQMVVDHGKEKIANQRDDLRNASDSPQETSSGSEESSQEEGASDQEELAKYPPHRRNARRRNGNNTNSPLDSSAAALNDDTTGEQRKSSFCKTDTLHTTILNEMRNKGLFKKLSSMGGENYIPEELGKMRISSTNKPTRHPCNSEPPIISHLPLSDKCLVNNQQDQVPLAAAATLEKQNSANNVLLRLPASSLNHHRRNNNNTTSLASSQSGSTYSDNFPERDSSDSVCHYNTGDQKEDRRLRDLHAIAREFYQVQKTYVELLQNIAENYPNYLSQCAEKSSRYQLNPTGKQPHVILRIAGHFQQILGVHKILLEDFTEKYSKWDSHKPDLANILQQKAEFLKICNSFLKEKRTLCAELQQVLDDNKELALATKRFEDTILNTSCNGDSNNGGSVMSLHGISLVMHLDAVHQNVVRYKLLMERYRKHLPDNLVEANISDEALKKLSAVSNTVNGFLADADADKKLLELHRKLDGVFDVFSPGRRLIHEGELQRQTRKELQLRYLILFSDTLLICRYALGSDHFDASRIYKIPILRVNVQTQEHEDYEREFTLQSPNKSSAFVAKSKRERDTWVNRIKEARTSYRDNKRKRKSYASKGFQQKPSTSNSQHNSCEDSPDVEHKAFDPVDTRPAATTIKSTRSSRHYEAVWIPDHKSTKCMMAGCDTKFSLIRRKHHCRHCGWLICRNCIGYAPVKVKNYEREKVCPQCYYDIKNSFEQGSYFPISMLETAQQVKTPIESTSSPITSNEIDSEQAAYAPKIPKYVLEDPALRIKYPDGRKEVVSALFTAPPNGALHKTSIAVDGKTEGGDAPLVASGKVIMKNRKGVDVLRWARLNGDMVLHFYEAEFDDEPCESHFVYGYSLETVDNEDGGCLIQLTHRNQFQTDRKEDRVLFQVMHAKSAEKWLEALQNGLGIFLEAE